jgi:hypothetical protein
MYRYVVTATLNGHTNAHIIEAHDTTDATFEAISFILDMAFIDKEGAWALGEIKLYDPYGTAMQVMGAK